MKKGLRHGPEGHTLLRCDSGWHGELVEPKLIDITPSPFLAGLHGSGNGVQRRLEMPDGVLVLGRITAAHMAALHAHAKLHPCVPHEDTIVATRTARGDAANVFDVRTHHWVFVGDHDEWIVRTARRYVESNDVMRFMLQIDSVENAVIGGPDVPPRHCR